MVRYYEIASQSTVCKGGWPLSVCSGWGQAVSGGRRGPSPVVHGVGCTDVGIGRLPEPSCTTNGLPVSLGTRTGDEVPRLTAGVSGKVNYRRSQNVSRVVISHWTLSIEGSRSRGKATSRWTIAPWPERLEARRRPKPTSESQPRR